MFLITRSFVHLKFSFTKSYSWHLIFYFFLFSLGWFPRLRPPLSLLHPCNQMLWESQRHLHVCHRLHPLRWRADPDVVHTRILLAVHRLRLLVWHWIEFHLHTELDHDRKMVPQIPIHHDGYCYGVGSSRCRCFIAAYTIRHNRKRITADDKSCRHFVYSDVVFMFVE